MSALDHTRFRTAWTRRANRPTALIHAVQFPLERYSPKGTTWVALCLAQVGNYNPGEAFDPTTQRVCRECRTRVGEVEF